MNSECTCQACGTNVRVISCNATLRACGVVIVLISLVTGCSWASSNGSLPRDAQASEATLVPTVGAGVPGTTVTSSSGAVPTWVFEVAEDEWALALQKSPGLARPEVEFLRASTPLDFADSYVACMHDAGFPAVTLMIDGGVSSGQLEEESFDAYLLADYECAVRYAINPTYYAPYSDEQMELIYDFYAEDLIPCITSLGFTVGEMPAFEVFAERELGGDPWNPVQLAAGTDYDVYMQIHESCETVPDGLY